MKQGTSEKPNRDPNTMGGFAKGLAVIEAFAGEGDRLTIAEAARRTGLDRAATRRCLLTLVAGGYAVSDGKQFSLTARILRLGSAYLSGAPLPRILQPYLEQLSQVTQESCSASVLDGTDIVYIARASQRRVMSIGLSVGSRLPAYCSSMGRVLLAALPPKEARLLLEGSDRQRLTQHTVTSLAGLSKELEKVRRQGFSTINEELEIGLRSIAVPITDQAGVVVAACNVGAQTGRVTMENMMDRFLLELRHTQAAVATLLPATLNRR
jgi:IclR family transcriptional regulator, pca regulon regulatory protein